MKFLDIGSGRFYLGDCIEVMKTIPNEVIDLILTDLPYGITSNKWDIQINGLFPLIKRISKNSLFITTCVQPYLSSLIAQTNNFAYELIWMKNLPTGFATSSKRPMRNHENIAVFYDKQPTYNPQMIDSTITDRKLGGSNGLRAKSKSKTYGKLENNTDEIMLKEKVNPRTIIKIDCVPRATGTLHPTQKPVALFEYLIKTYTNEGDLVLDCCAGSGTTAIACQNTNRKWVCIEKDEDYANAAVNRIDKHIWGNGK